MPRAGLSTDAVVDAAIALIDADGPDALTLAAVAASTGVATPSLYKHVRSLGELRTLVAVRVFEEMTDRLGAEAMGRSGPDALRAAMVAYRAFAVEYPNRYAALPQSATHEPALDAPAERLLGVILAALRGYGLEGSALIHAARCFRAAAHGFAALEIAGGFGLPEKLDESYALLTEMLSDGLRGLA